MSKLPSIKNQILKENNKAIALEQDILETKQNTVRSTGRKSTNKNTERSLISSSSSSKDGISSRPPASTSSRSYHSNTCRSSLSNRTIQDNETIEKQYLDCNISKIKSLLSESSEILDLWKYNRAEQFITKQFITKQPKMNQNLVMTKSKNLLKQNKLENDHDLQLELENTLKDIEDLQLRIGLRAKTKNYERSVSHYFNKKH